MSEEILEILKNINQNLEDIKKQDNMPKLVYAKEIAETYNVNRNKAIDFCKMYGINFGGYCIEADKLKEILQTKGFRILKEVS
jgi:hypothetical protein